MRIINSIPILIAIIFISCFYFIINQMSNSRDYVYKVGKLELSLVPEGKIDLNQFRGKKIILHLFSSWCESCKEDLPYIEKLKHMHNAIAIGVAMKDKNPQSNKTYDFLTEDRDFALYRLIRNKSIPETLIISSEGMVLEHYSGPLKNSLGN